MKRRLWKNVSVTMSRLRPSHLIRFMDWIFLSPEMKSTGEAIGYDDSLNRAMYKTLKLPRI